MFEQDWFAIVLQALMAAFGALARLVNKKNVKLSLSGALGDLFVAGFTGVLLYWVGQALPVASGMLYALAGISGWIGPQALDAISHTVAKKAGVNLKDSLGKTEIEETFIDDEEDDVG